MDKIEKMTKRERFLAAMRREATDGELVWAPNFDYWLAINRAQNTLPEKYQGMTRNNIVRAINGTIWHRVSSCGCQHDPSIKHTYSERQNGVRRHEIQTPIGSIYEEYALTESEHSSEAHIKHFVTDYDSLRVMTYVVEGTQYNVDMTFAAAHKAIEETGDDGIVLDTAVCLPLIQFAKTDAGYMNAFYLMEDYSGEVDYLISVYHKKFVELYRALSNSPADVIAFGDNMDEVMISPNLFEKYAVGFYQESKDALKGTDKILGAHWCGRTPHLLSLVPKTGLDVVEAIVTEPMADITLDSALDKLDGKVTLQGGMPSVMVCPDIVSQRDFENYIESAVLKQKGRKGFILGMSDNVPPNADFSRVEMIAELIK